LKERYEDLVENANDMVFTHDLSGNLTSINKTGEQILGRPRDAILSKNLIEFVVEEQRAAAAHWLAQVTNSAELPPAEWDCLNSAGQRIRLEISTHEFARENSDPAAWQQLMQGEKARGITYVVLAGAEPSLVPDLLEICFQEMPLVCIASNGFKRIPDSVGYKIHVSVWGNDETSLRIRKAKHLLLRQIENYREDPRAVFVYTFTKSNIDEVREVVETLADQGCKATFNVFSAPIGYDGPLRHDRESLSRMRKIMLELMASFPDHILFSPYNVVAHTHRLGLHDLYACSYPRMNLSTDIGLGRSFRQYHADLSWDRSVACCVPDTDCEDCRHYAAGSAIVTARLYRHATDPMTFKSWLDYVDTYLAVWVMGYEKRQKPL